MLNPTSNSLKTNNPVFNNDNARCKITCQNLVKICSSRFKGTSLFPRFRVFIHRLRICCLGLAIGFHRHLCRGGFFVPGRSSINFALTLDSGNAPKPPGRFFMTSAKIREKHGPFHRYCLYDTDPATESKEFDLVYPVLTYECYGMEYRWQLAQLLSFSGGQDPDNSTANASRFSRSIFSNVRRTG